MPYPVKFFTNDMGGAPALVNNWGDLTALLDACLINGFNSKTLTSLTRSGQTVTATISAGGHGFIVNQIVLISGAVQSEYNGEQRVTAVTATTFTFEIAAGLTPTTPASGTVSAKAAPLGFETVFTATNKRVYRSANPQSSRLLLRVDDSLDPAYTTTYAKYAKVTLVESMSGIDTFTGAQAPYDSANPNKNHIGSGWGSTVMNGWFKWLYSRASNNDSAGGDSSVKRWVLVGDDKGFYLHINPFAANSNHGYAGYHFGDIKSYRAGDAYHALMCAHDFYVAANNNGCQSPYHKNIFPSSKDGYGRVMLKDHTQAGSYIQPTFNFSNAVYTATATSGFDAGLAYPNPVDGSLILSPVALLENTNQLRGILRGCYFSAQSLVTIPDKTILIGILPDDPTRRILTVALSHTNAIGSGARVFYDLDSWE